jgi:hypothetical protein
MPVRHVRCGRELEHLALVEDEIHLGRLERAQRNTRLVDRDFQRATIQLGLCAPALCVVQR